MEWSLYCRTSGVMMLPLTQLLASQVGVMKQWSLDSLMAIESIESHKPGQMPWKAREKIPDLFCNPWVYRLLKGFLWRACCNQLWAGNYLVLWRTMCVLRMLVRSWWAMLACQALDALHTGCVLQPWETWMQNGTEKSAINTTIFSSTTSFFSRYYVTTHQVSRNGGV